MRVALVCIVASEPSQAKSYTATTDPLAFIQQSRIVFSPTTARGRGNPFALIRLFSSFSHMFLGRYCLWVCFLPLPCSSRVIRITRIVWDASATGGVTVDFIMLSPGEYREVRQPRDDCA